MRKYLYGLLAALLLISPASADWTGKNAAGSTITFKNPNDCTSVVCVPMSQPYDGTNAITFTTAGADNVSNTLTGMPTYSRMQVFDGTTWDRWTGTVTVSNTNANGQATMANSSPVVLPSNMSAIALWGHGATGAAVPANATYFGFNSGGNLTAPSTSAPLPTRPGDGTRQVVIDPCEANAHSYTTGVITSATTTRIIAPSASNKTYLCAFFMKASAADNVAVVEGTGGTCGTGTAALLGGTTTANGFVFGTAGDGVLLQAGGKVAIVQTAGTNVDTCLITSTTGPLIWSAKYVQAP